jgi:hypothetical protein
VRLLNGMAQSVTHLKMCLRHQSGLGLQPVISLSAIELPYISKMVASFNEDIECSSMVSVHVVIECQASAGCSESRRYEVGD